MSMIDIRVVDADNADLHALIRNLDADLLERYPAEEIFGVDFDDPSVKEMVFVVAYEGEEAVGCGGIRPYGGGIVELKRLFVDPGHRKKGIASRILDFLEGKALELGSTAVRLETGAPQPESIQLYLKYGYTAIERFGEYADSESSLCFEKKLA